MRPAPGGWNYPTNGATHPNQISGLNDAARHHLGATDGGTGARHRARRARIGEAQGNHDAGPIGAVVGGAVGAVAGILGVEDRPRFHEYVVRERVPSYRYDNDFRVGAVLPENGVTYYDVPADYHVIGYRYSYVNDYAVLVDPRTRRIVQIID